MSADTAPAPAMPAIAPARASLADWLAVMAGTLGAMMALMDVSIVNSSLPKIQGEIGATQAEGTWVNTAYLVAEIVVIPLTAWLERLLGLRRLLLGAALLFTSFSVLCGLSSSLTMMIAGRIGQGFSGGVLIPSALTLVATRLPPRQQIVGLALTAVSALLGPAAGPVIGGWLTENYGWNYAFFINVPICAVQAAMMLLGIRKTPGDASELRKADWAGVVGMVIGLGAMTTLLEEGQREQWFESALIWRLALASLFGFALIAWGQLRAKRPVVRLSLLRNRALASAVGLLAGLGMLLYTGIFITPQFLVTVSGYNAEQAGRVAFLSGAIAIPTAMLFPLLSRFLSERTIVAGAMFSVAFGDYLLSGMTVSSAGSDFTVAQVFYGVGTTMSAMPLQGAVISSVPPQDAAEAISLSSVSRNLGGSIGLAALASFQEQRFDFHHWQISSTLGANDMGVQQQVAAAAQVLGGGPEGMAAAYQALNGQMLSQALVMSFNDVYLALFLAGILVIPLAMFLKSPPKGSSPMAMH